MALPDSHQVSEKSVLLIGTTLTTLKIAFIIFSILSFAGIFASLARGNVRPSGAER
jgi:hypothetical protein